MRIYNYSSKIEKAYNTVVILLMYLPGLEGEIIMDGECPDIPVKQNVEVSNYMGKWYQQAHYPENREPVSICHEALYTLSTNDVIEVKQSKLLYPSMKKKTIIGTLKPAAGSHDGKFLINFPFKRANPVTPYWILDTDYSSYSIVWSCRQEYAMEKLTNTRHLWILTRSPQLHAETIKIVYDIVENLPQFDREEIRFFDNYKCLNKTEIN